MMQFTGLSVFTAAYYTWWLPRCPVVKTLLPMQGAWVPSYAEELRSFLPGCEAKKNTTKHLMLSCSLLVRVLVFPWTVRNFHIASMKTFSASSAFPLWIWKHTPLVFSPLVPPLLPFMWLVGWVCSGVSDQNILSGPSLGSGWECQPSPHLCLGPGRWGQLTSLFQDPPPQALPWNTPEVASPVGPPKYYGGS